MNLTLYGLEGQVSGRENNSETAIYIVLVLIVVNGLGKYGILFGRLLFLSPQTVKTIICVKHICGGDLLGHRDALHAHAMQHAQPTLLCALTRPLLTGRVGSPLH